MVALAPHLVRPLALVVPAFDGVRPDRLMGVGLNLYDVMSRDRKRYAPRGRRGLLEPRAPPHDLGGGGARAAPCAGRARAHQRVPLLRLPDRRRASGADGARRGRALRRGLRQPPWRARRCSKRRAARGGCACATRSPARSSTCAPPTLSTPPACGPTSCAPRSSTGEAELPRSVRSRGTHVTLRHEDLPLGAGAIVPARRGPHDLRAAVAGAHAGGHHRQRLRGRLSEHVRALRRGQSSTCWRPSTTFFATDPAPRAISPAPTPGCGH